MEFSDFRRRQQQRDPREFIAPALIVAGVLFAVFLVWNCYYTVEPNEQAVVLPNMEAGCSMADMAAAPDVYSA